MNTLKRIIKIVIVNFIIITITVLLKSTQISDGSTAFSENILSASVLNPTPPAINRRKTNNDERTSINPDPTNKIIISPAEALAKTTDRGAVQASVDLSSRCIVMVDNVRFDVTEFRKIHQGGDIFQCGTDMSQIFHGQHDAEIFARFQKYRVP